MVRAGTTGKCRKPVVYFGQSMVLVEAATEMAHSDIERLRWMKTQQE
jgi:hypothetical protein